MQETGNRFSSARNRVPCSVVGCFLPAINRGASPVARISRRSGSDSAKIDVLADSSFPFRSFTLGFQLTKETSNDLHCSFNERRLTSTEAQVNRPVESRAIFALPLRPPVSGVLGVNANANTRFTVGSMESEPGGLNVVFVTRSFVRFMSLFRIESENYGNPQKIHREDFPCDVLFKRKRC